MKSGARPVLSSYNYETGMIGPYKVPIAIEYKPQDAQKSSVQNYRVYRALLSDDSAIAAFNNCNNTIVVVCRNHMYTVPTVDNPSKMEQKAIRDFSFKEPIYVPSYKHIGYVKTYPQCKAVYEFPWQLIQDVNTGEIWEYENVRLDCVPVENPPLSLYKALIDTDYKAAYIDSATGDYKFI